jgi:Na+-driven multidrug efflux pump
VIDGVVNGVARLVGRLSSAGRRMQTGNVSNYGLAVLVGISLLLGFILLRWNG